MSSAGVLRIAYSGSAAILQRGLVSRNHLTRCYSTRPNGTVKNNRSYLFVPGSEAHKIEKSLTISSSVIIYDLESSVDPAKKSHAREYLRYFLTEPRSSVDTPLPAKERVAVRINSLNSVFCIEDIKALASVESMSILVLPKVDCAENIEETVNKIMEHSKAKPRTKMLNIIASIGSTRGLYNIREIANWSYKAKSSRFRLSGLLFSAEDFCANSSVVRTQGSQELLHARSEIALVARANQLEAIDMACIKYNNEEQLQLECSLARQQGFTGKQAVHPDQVELIQNAFIPSSLELERANNIVAQMKESRREGKGVFGLENGWTDSSKEMIDGSVFKQATKTIELAKAV